ncbi:MAG: hypothetical protein H0T43_08180 [Solirubrobacterales bacterium]|nr:hypothetical protein [Solirubrobacterales bacterium]
MSASPRLHPSDLLRFAAIAFLLLEGGIHLQQYEGPLNPVPTISTLFVLNAVAAAAISLALAASRRHVAVLAALAGLGLTLGALVSLAISRASVLFDYTEPTLRAGVTFALVAELGAVLALSGFLFAWLRER